MLVSLMFHKNMKKYMLVEVIRWVISSQLLTGGMQNKAQQPLL